MTALDQLKELREQTGISYSECQKALKEANGDLDKAKDILRRLGKEVADKKQSRHAGEGRIEAYVHATGTVGVLVDVRCETDFVAKSDDFKQLTHELALQIASMNPDGVEDLLEQQYIKDTSLSIQDVVREAVAKLGENIVVERFERFDR
jgi:elongation factor Ts